MSRSYYHKLPEMDQASATPASAAASRINASCDIKSEIFCSAPWLWFDDVWCSQDAIIIKSSSPLSFSSSSLEDKSCNVAGLVVQTCRSTTGIRDQHQSPRFRCFGETFMVGSCISSFGAAYLDNKRLMPSIIWSCIVVITSESSNECRFSKFPMLIQRVPASCETGGVPGAACRNMSVFADNLTFASGSLGCLLTCLRW